MTIEATLRSLGIEQGCSQNLSGFLDLFEKWNRSINLSAATTRDEITEHLVDSLHVIPHLRERARVLDVGSGGGFPVVVAAICVPTSSFVALEPVHKKHAFLRTVARELALVNLEARAERLDDHADGDYDAAMSRATFDLAQWLVHARRFVSASGVVIGFEAITRTDLPARVERHPYTLRGKQRAIILDRG